MNVTNLILRDFRNAEYDELEFSDGVNVICGANAAGKTNILEAIFYFAAGKSFRNCKDRELIRFGCESASAQMSFMRGGNRLVMSALLPKGGRRVIRMGESGALKMAEYLGEFRAVIFTPDHLSLVKGAPEFRRRFLDLAICQSFPRYASSLSEYNRVLAQKNALLKRGTVQDELLAVYNERMAALAAIISVNRGKYLARLENEACGFLTDLSGQHEKLSLSYQSQVDGTGQEEIKNGYKELLAGKAETEKEKRLALYGSHKDDFSVHINGRNAKAFASQGQQRSAVLALKLAEGELSRGLTGEYPVFLLDDILSELDSARKSYVLSKIGSRQVIITGCESEAFAQSGGKTLFVEDGKCFCN